MTFTLRKTEFTRLSQSLLLTAKLLASPMIGFLLAWLVIRLFSRDLWGSLAEHSLWVYVLAAVASWGSKDYLLRRFSEKPAAFQQLFCSSILTRSLLIPFCLLMLWIHTGNQWTLFLLSGIWLIARFLYQSFDPLIFFEKKFGTLVFVEIFAGLAAIAGIVFYGPGLSTYMLIAVLMLADWLKVIILVVIFNRIYQRISFWRFDTKHLVNALSFVGLGLTGLLVSRTDQFIVNYYLPNAEKAFYQVFLNLLSFLMLIPGLILSPQIKNLYRSPAETFRKIQWLIIRAGMIVIPLGLLLIWFVLAFLFGFDCSVAYLLLGALLVLPMFFQTGIIYLAYKNHHQAYILIITLIGLMVSLLLGNYLTPIYAAYGALIGAVAGQWLIGLLVLAGYYSGYLQKARNAGSEKKEVPWT